MVNTERLVNIVFRADASKDIGTGHIMRCLTLAEELRMHDTNISFICRHLQDNLCHLIVEKGFTVYETFKEETRNCPESSLHIETDITETVRILQKIGCIDWIIIDQYEINKQWEQAIRPYTKRVMVIDDLANRAHDCDLLLDQTFAEDGMRYEHLIPSHCVCLFGTKYALLRPEFKKYKKAPPHLSIKNKFDVHVFFGGIDTNNYTFRFSQLVLQNFSNMRVKIAVGEQYKFTDCLRQLQETYKERVEWKQNVLNMASYMADCDVALGAPGITTWERACVGLPTAYLAVSDNQRDILAKLEKKKLCLNLGSAASIQDQEFIERFLQFMNDQKKRKQFYETSIGSVDGLGVNRVVYQLLRLEKGEETDGFEFHDI